MIKKGKPSFTKGAPKATMTKGQVKNGIIKKGPVKKGPVKKGPVKKTPDTVVSKRSPIKMVSMAPGEVVDVSIGDVVELGMTEYGIEVVEQRAVPDFRDGLKPVQRRILFSMFKRGVTPGGRFKKSAATVGDVGGKYHPHGDAAIYDALVKMVQAHRYPLLEGYGNFGGINDPTAAMRYTECKSSLLGWKLFDHHEVMQMIPNYDESTTEPVMLPSRLPVLLMNGSRGPAVGIATNIPPHNLVELSDALALLVKNRKASTKDLLKIIKGPDYSLGGVLLSPQKDVYRMYKKGQGTLHYRCEYHYEREKQWSYLIVTAPAPDWNPTSFMERIMKLTEQKKIKDITVSEETTKKDGFKFVVQFKNADMLNRYILPMLETKVTYHFYVTQRLDEDTVLVKATNLRKYMKWWLKFQRKIETAKLQWLVEQLTIAIQRREARIDAMKDLDRFFAALKKKSLDATRDALKKGFKWNDLQVDYMLSIQTGSLARAVLKDQESKLKEQYELLKSYNTRLKNIDQEILNNLADLRKVDYEVSSDRVNVKRITRLSERRTLIEREQKAAAQVEAPASGSIVIGCESGLIKEVKNATREKIVGATNKAKFYVVTKTGMGTVCNYADLGSFRPDSCRAIVPGGVKKLVVLDNTGKALTIPTDNLRQQFSTMRTEDPIKTMVGLAEDDVLIAYNDKYTHVRFIDEEDLEGKKRQQKGKNIIPSVRRGVNIKRFRYGTDKLVDKDGRVLPTKPESFAKGVFIVSKLNLVNVGGTWKPMNRKLAVRAISQGKVKDIINL